MLFQIFVLEVDQELVFVAYLEELANSSLVVIKDTVKLWYVLVAVFAEPVFDTGLVLVLANDILGEHQVLYQCEPSETSM